MFDFACPSCGARGQKFSVLGSLFRVALGRCNACRAWIESDLGEGRYLLFCVYAHLIGATAGLIVVACLLAGRWWVAVASVALFAFLVFPVAMHGHARRVLVGHPLFKRPDSRSPDVPPPHPPHLE